MSPFLSSGRPRKSADQRISKPFARYYEPYDEIVDGDPELDDSRYELWSRQIKATLPRIKLLKFMDEDKDPPPNGYSIKELRKALDLPFATLYRTAEKLAENGILSRIEKAGHPRTLYFLTKNLLTKTKRSLRGQRGSNPQPLP